MTQPILEVANLRIEFPSIYQTESTVAVNGISFEVLPGQVLGLVGESGSGKSVTSLAIMGLVPTPGKVTQGEILFRSGKSGSNQEMITATNLLDANNREKLRQYRGGEIATIFQEPMSSLNPVYNIGFQITEAIQLHQPSVTPEQAKQQAIALLQQVQLLPSDEQLEEDAADKISNANSKDRKEYVKQQKRLTLKALPPSTVWRTIATGHDRHGHFLRPDLVDCRRADNRLRCDGSSRNSAFAEGSVQK